MTKDPSNRRKKNARFWLIMAIYALVVLILIVVGLMWFWDYIAAYENAVPAQEAIDVYSAQLDQDMLLNMEWETFDKVDGRLQTEEECRAILEKELSGKFVFAKSLALSTDSKVVYDVKRNIKVVGQVTVEKISTDKYGFEQWAVTGESYDVEPYLEALLGQSQTITVPSSYRVYANDRVLDESFITESRSEWRMDTGVGGVPTGYEQVTYCTYEVGAILGAVTLRTEDGSGNAPAEETRPLLTECAEEEIGRIDSFLWDFVTAYVDFTTVRGGKDNTYANYKDLITYIVDGSKLEGRMEESIAGLAWIKDREAEIESVTVDQCFRMEDGRYLCEFTYTVESLNQGKFVKTTETILMVITDETGELLAESMLSK
jgi:hypothetical protein